MVEAAEDVKHGTPVPGRVVRPVGGAAAKKVKSEPSPKLVRLNKNGEPRKKPAKAKPRILR